MQRAVVDAIAEFFNHMTADLNFIHQFIPGSSDRTLLLLHGTGGNEQDLLPLGRELDPAAALLSPRGQVSENGHPRFFRRLAEGVFDLEDLKQRTDDLADFIESAARSIIELAISARWWRSAIPMVRTSPRASCCAARDPANGGFVSRDGAVACRKSCRTSPGCGFGSRGGKEDGSSRRPRRSDWPTCCAAAGAEVTARFFEPAHGLTNTEFVLAAALAA